MDIHNNNNLLIKLPGECLSYILNYLSDEELLRYAKAYKINGIEIDRLINYCIKELPDKYDNSEICCDDFIVSCKCNNVEHLKEFKKIINFDDNSNIKYLSKHFKLNLFPKMIKQNKDYVLEFIKQNPFNIRYADNKFLNDKKIMKLVIKKYTNLYQFLPEKLCKDKDIKNFARLSFHLKRLSRLFKRSFFVWAKKKERELPLTGHAAYPLCAKFYLDEKNLTDKKYIKMRERARKKREKEEIERLKEETERREREEENKIMDNKYREENGLLPNETIYRNSSGNVCSQQEYLDDYYETKHHYIDGYD